MQPDNSEEALTIIPYNFYEYMEKFINPAIQARVSSQTDFESYLRLTRAFEDVGTRGQFLTDDERLQFRTQYNANVPLQLNEHERMDRPSELADKVAEINPQSWQHALVLGEDRGYTAMVFAGLTKSVHMVVQDHELAEETNIRVHAHGNPHVIVYEEGDPNLGIPDEKFDVIFIFSPVEDIPPAIRTQLAPNGTMLVRVRNEFGIDEWTHVIRTPEGVLLKEEQGKVGYVPIEEPQI